MATRPLGVSSGGWHQDICSGSFVSCMFGVGASMDWTCPGTYHRCSCVLGSWVLGGPLKASGSLLCYSSHSWSVFVVSQGAMSCWGGHCHEGWTWSTKVFGCVVGVKCHPHECQDPRTLSRTWHYYEMVKVNHIACQCFNVVAAWRILALANVPRHEGYRASGRSLRLKFWHLTPALV